MAQLIANRRAIEFVLYEQMEVETLLKEKKYTGLNRKMIDMLISEAANLGIKEILPTWAEGDREGVRFESGNVSTPECFKRPHQLIREGGWVSLAEKTELGGQGLPHVVACALREYLHGANSVLISFACFGHGTGKMIELYGTETQKRLFLTKLYTGEWAGTMLLTEPQAGSDVGALTTSAVINPDGTYSLSGNKIFISNGDHDLSENIIHPVLARIEGAAKGAKGISIFIVPKIWVNDDGSLGEPNDIVCTGIEEKMGTHGSPTCSMALGSKGICRGLLLGKANQGMRIMFHMMNEARLYVGYMGFVFSSIAYMYGLSYAKERLQGKDLSAGKDPEAAQVPIIRHPDVRRMLTWMKAHVEGMRSFVYYVYSRFDRAACAGTDSEKERFNEQIALLTPVVKAYCATRGFEVCVQAMQVYGGYGYIRDYPPEQLARDCKLMSIFEGTDGIQAMDLLGRKLGMKNGAVFMDFLGEIKKTIAMARDVGGLDDLAEKLEGATEKLGETAMHIGMQAMSPEIKTAFSFAHPFLMAMGDVCMAWMLLWRAVAAGPKLDDIVNGKKGERRSEIVQHDASAAFYDGQLKTAAHYIETLLPETLGKMEGILRGNQSTVTMDERAFG